MTTTDRNEIIAKIENCCLSNTRRDQVIALFAQLWAEEEHEDAQKEQEEQEEQEQGQGEPWNPYTDPDYMSEDRENARLQALAGWHHVQEI